VEKQSAVKNRPVQMEDVAGGIKVLEYEKRDIIELEPRYSTNEVPGRCIKCLAEEKMFSCMRELLKDEKDTGKLQQRYQILYSFLESPDLQKLCDETEKCLSEGKEVSVRIYFEDSKIKYELKIKGESGKN